MSIDNHNGRSNSLRLAAGEVLHHPIQSGALDIGVGIGETTAGVALGSPMLEIGGLSLIGLGGYKMNRFLKHHTYG